MPAYVALRHVRFDDAGLLAKTIAEIIEAGEHDGVRVDGLDGVAFAPGEYYLTLATWTDGSTGRRAALATTPGSRSSTARCRSGETDLLTMYDYLWRWDTDWFWCSGAFGVPAPAGAPAVAAALAALRRLPPADRAGPPPRHRRPARPARRPARSASASSRTSRCRSSGCAEFLAWFDEAVGMRPVWLCPLRSTSGPGPRYPLAPGATYVNVGFWGTVHVGPDAPDGPRNRAIEERVHRARRPQVALLRGVLRPARRSTGSTTAPTSRRSRRATTPTTG